MKARWMAALALTTLLPFARADAPGSAGSPNPHDFGMKPPEEKDCPICRREGKACAMHLHERKKEEARRKESELRALEQALPPPERCDLCRRDGVCKGHLRELRKAWEQRNEILAERREGCVDRWSPLRAQALQHLLKRFDASGDGKLSKAELSECRNFLLDRNPDLLQEGVLDRKEYRGGRRGARRGPRTKSQEAPRDEETGDFMEDLLAGSPKGDHR